MKKILVTTDFSTASKAGMRFAIQLASQMEVELVFFHCFQALIPLTVQRDRIVHSLEQQMTTHQRKLEIFVAQIYQSTKVQAGAHRCVVVEYLDPEQAIIDYAHKNGVQFICMSTRGAGAVLKLIGTHTGNILQRSVVPVLAIPHTYRMRPIERILYSTDLENFDKEMAVVAAFAENVKVKVDMAHFYFPGQISLDPETLGKMWQMKYPRLGQVYLEQSDLDLGFKGQLARLTQKTKPSLIVFFTHPKKTWFDKLFGASLSESFSFATKVPMLVYRKMGA